MSLPSSPSKSFVAANPHLYGPRAVAGLMSASKPVPPESSAEPLTEKRLQDQIEQMLKRLGCWVIRQRMDRRSNVAIGTPDILFAWDGAAVAFEAKLPGKQPTTEQRQAMAHMERNGWRVFVVHGVGEAAEILEQFTKTKP